jgi:hypothetical protein
MLCWLTYERISERGQSVWRAAIGWIEVPCAAATSIDVGQFKLPMMYKDLRSGSGGVSVPAYSIMPAYEIVV